MNNTRLRENCLVAEEVFESSKKRKNKHKTSKKQKGGKQNKKKAKKTSLEGLNCCLENWEASNFMKIPKIKKKKKRKDKEVEVTLEAEDDSLLTLATQKHKHPTKTSCTAHKGEDKFSVRPLLSEKQSEFNTRLTKNKPPRKKKRVVFDLSPEWSQPKMSKAAVLHTSGDTALCFGARLCVKENQPEESQGTSDDLNSQDLFLTQKSFTISHRDFPSSLSPIDAVAEPLFECVNQKERMISQEPRLHRSMVEASTQTENFFTSTELSTSLRFHLLCAATKCTKKPVDLSLPKRETPNLNPNLRIHAVDEDCLLQQTNQKISNPVLKEDGDAFSRSKGDLSRQKVVQTRLNESFFFKVKGEADSPKPLSPLMKFRESVESGPKKSY